MKTQQYTNLWGIAAKSKDQKDAISLVKDLSSKDTVLGFSKAFGVMPAIKSAAPDFKAAFPNLAAYADSLAWSVPDPTVPGWSTLQTKFDGTLATWRKDNIKPSPKDLLDTSQTNLKQLIASGGNG
jgi:multiple sugar transport system substrate-binding protein